MILRPFYKIPPHDWLLTSNGDISAAQTKAIAEPTKGEHYIEEYVRQ